MTVSKSKDQDTLLLMQALLDGELDAESSLALERRIAAEPELANHYAKLQALKQRIAGLPKPRVSRAFHDRIAKIATPLRRRWVENWQALAASILVTAMLSSSATYVLTARNDSAAMLEVIASSHRRSLLAATPFDVASSDRHTVKPWLDARLGLSPPAPDLAAQGFALVGGRIEVIAGKPVPSLVYRHNEHLISLVAIPREAGTAAEPQRSIQANGLRIEGWSDPAFTYWAVSDMEPAELQAFAAHFRQNAAAG